MSTPTNFVNSYDVPLRASKVIAWLAVRFCAVPVAEADFGGTAVLNVDATAPPFPVVVRKATSTVARARDRPATGLGDPAGARSVDDVGDRGRPVPPRGHGQLHRADVRSVARGDHVVDEVGRAAGAGRPGQRGAQDAAAQEERLAEVRDLARGGGRRVGVGACAGLQRRPRGDRGDRRRRAAGSAGPARSSTAPRRRRRRRRW